MSLFQENNMNGDPLYTTEVWEDCGPSAFFPHFFGIPACSSLLTLLLAHIILVPLTLSTNL